MVVLSIDLASKQSGWALFTGDKELTKWGIIKPKTTLKADERLPVIVDEITILVEKYAPDKVLLEIPAGGREDYKGPEASWLTMSVLFMVHGAVRYILQQFNTPYELISPSTWQNRNGLHKRDRAARKAAAKEFALKLYPEVGEEEQDIYDAINIFECYKYLRDWKDPTEEVSAF